MHERLSFSLTRAKPASRPDRNSSSGVAASRKRQRRRGNRRERRRVRGAVWIACKTPTNNSPSLIASIVARVAFASTRGWRERAPDADAVAAPSLVAVATFEVRPRRPSSTVPADGTAGLSRRPGYPRLATHSRRTFGERLANERASPREEKSAPIHRIATSHGRRRRRCCHVLAALRSTVHPIQGVCI